MKEAHLSKGARKTARALIEVVKPRKPGVNIPAEDFMLNFLDNFYSYFPVHMRIGFPLGLMLLEYGTFIFAGIPKPFSSLSMEKREKYVKGWINSRLGIRRDLIKGVKGVCLTAFYSHPDAMAQIGYNLDEHLERVNRGEPADEEACRFFRELGYDRNSRIPYPAFDNVEVIPRDTEPEPGKEDSA